MSRRKSSFVQTFLAGLLAVLPIVLTVVVVLWVVDLLRRHAGPQSQIGKLLHSIGLSSINNPTGRYLTGFVVVVLLIYLLGLLVRTKLSGHLQSLMGRVLGAIPVVGSIYNMSSRFVGIFERKGDTDLKAMSPVWCFLGGEGGTAVLALMPTPESVLLEGKRYRAVLLPSAPVPFGGAILYVPEDWVKPASFGIEALTSIYVSMGVSSTQYLEVPPPEGELEPTERDETGKGEEASPG